MAEEETKEKKPNMYYVVLDRAALETVKSKRGNFELLNCDDHRSMASKLKKDPVTLRPDILHQELLALLDSPLNKSGRLKVFINTSKNVLIDVNPAIRIPRTFKRFSGLMVQLLHKLKIRSSNGSETLLKVVKAPYTRHIPAGTHVYVFSVTGTLYNPNQFAAALPEDEPVCFVLGAMASGHIEMSDHPQAGEKVSLSEYPLSGATAINRLLGAIENHNGIF
mmetsp:Transcript_20230/g.26728  ORF Transcript_20230/g.26728 Transcript_20230/m.26728 type:complete len:222 (+) Transcript_20230:246-911(+)|eukprot:CAMPEP_0117736498 /NCGR_PEP_ID=MMETSP0947-20121206/1966_1 /TAXON_ID=44440 /ORGANISM="Chattonella subsalsa, Strain CCMP2191" /LENGTH=221 /DNA_ID=CAMNT_0005551801 /DNA_START=140 /DNA_END=805 /DNA_ORIENTATION=-